MRKAVDARRRRLGGLTLVEVMVAIVMLAIAAYGTVALAINGRIGVERAGQERTAAHVGHEQLERARAGIGTASGTTLIDSITYTWTVTTAAATNADGSTYNTVSVTVKWPQATGPQQMTLTTGIAP